MKTKVNLPIRSLIFPFVLLGLAELGCDGSQAEKTSKKEAAQTPRAGATKPHDSTKAAADDQGTAADPHAHHRHHAGLQIPAEAPLSGASLFHVESTFTTQAGKDLQLKELGGKPSVVAMVYTHCEHACPMIVADMKAIEKGLSDEQRRGVHFVLASIDPERDTVERLSAFAKQASLDASHWTLLRAEAGTVRELAAVLGVKYRPEPPSDFAHSNLLTVLDADGVIVHRQEGLGSDPKDSISALLKQLGAKRERVSPE